MCGMNSYFLFQVFEFDSPVDLKGVSGNIIVLKIVPQNDQLSPTIKNVVIKACFEPAGKLIVLIKKKMTN